MFKIYTVFISLFVTLSSFASSNIAGSWVFWDVGNDASGNVYIQGATYNFKTDGTLDTCVFTNGKVTNTAKSIPYTFDGTNLNISGSSATYSMDSNGPLFQFTGTNGNTFRPFAKGDHPFGYSLLCGS